MFGSRYRKTFGKEVGAEFERLELEIGNEADAARWLEAVSEWLKEIPPEDRLDCLRMVWLERKEVRVNADTAKWLAGLTIAKQNLAMKEQQSKFPMLTGTEKQRLNEEASELQRKLQDAERDLDEYRAGLEADAAFLQENRERLAERYGKPSLLPILPTMGQRQTVTPSRVKVRYYMKLFGRECGREFAIFDETFHDRAGGADFIREMVEWLSKIETKDRLPALKLAELKREHKHLKAAVAEGRLRDEILEEQARIAHESGNQNLAEHIRGQRGSARRHLDDLVTMEAGVAEAIAILAPIDEKYGSAPVLVNPPVESVPWLNWNAPLN